MKTLEKLLQLKEMLYPYFKDSYKMIAIDLSKQQALDADPRAIRQINFTPNLDRAGNTRHCKSIVNMLCNNFYSDIK